MVEILSRATLRRDRTEKKDVYERNGVDEYWIVDPDRQEVTVFTLSQGVYDAGQTFSAGRVVSRVLPALVASVDGVFAT